jgi:hypothetical protein
MNFPEGRMAFTRDHEVLNRFLKLLRIVGNSATPFR